MDWATVEPIIVTGVVAITGGGVAAATGKLFSMGSGLARMEQKIDDHIVEEKDRDAAVAQTLADMSKKLPNGELALLINKLGMLEQKICPDDDPRFFTPRKKRYAERKQYARKRR